MMSMLLIPPMLIIGLPLRPSWWLIWGAAVILQAVISSANLGNHMGQKKILDYMHAVVLKAQRERGMR